MATIVGDFQKGTKVISNLDTYNHTAAAASMYTVSLAMSEQPPSGLVIQIKQNGSTIATAPAPTAAQQVCQISTVLNCAANDLISVVISSAVPTDQNINAIKGILNIRQGTV